MRFHHQGGDEAQSGHPGLLGTDAEERNRELRGLREAMNAFAIEEGFILTNNESGS